MAILFRNKLTMLSIFFIFNWLGLTGLRAEETGNVSNDVLQITEVKWTNEVDPETRNPKKVYQEGTALKGQPLYLWMKVRGEKQALDKLTQDHKLPIRHKWFSYIGTRPYFDSTKEPTDTIDLSIGRHEVLSELNAELDSQGFFEWRVWSGKTNVRIGWWRVDVVYADNKPVFCGKDPCSYNILVKE